MVSYMQQHPSPANNAALSAVNSNYSAGTNYSPCSSNITICLDQYYRAHGGQVNQYGIPTGRGYNPGPAQNCGAWGCDIITGQPNTAPSVIPRPVYTEPVIHHDPGCGFLGLGCAGHWVTHHWRGIAQTAIAVACLFRGFSGDFPRRSGRKMLDLAPDALVIRPFWSSPFRAKFRIPREAITSAHLRPPRLGESGKVMDDGIYPAGAIFAWAAFVVIICESADGKFELGVPRPDVPLVLHYLNPRAAAPADGRQ